jgi:hypothetical protein
MLFSNGLGPHLRSLLDKMNETPEKDKLRDEVNELRQRLGGVRGSLAAKPESQKDKGHSVGSIKPRV